MLPPKPNEYLDWKYLKEMQNYVFKSGVHNWSNYNELKSSQPR